MAGFGSPLFLIGLGNGSTPTPSAGVRSMLAPWIGGAGVTPSSGSPSGYRSLLAFWAGGAANIGEAPQPEPETPRPITAGNLDERRYRYRWAEGYRKRKQELFGRLEDAQEEIVEQVARLVGEREQVAEEASLALDQGQDIFLQAALAAMRRIDAELASLGVAAPAFDTRELDMVYVIAVLMAEDDF